MIARTYPGLGHPLDIPMDEFLEHYGSIAELNATEGHEAFAIKRQDRLKARMRDFYGSDGR